ncbi:hypothetical protein L1987_47143 [Smallanthus sonchifolius]|uniref:Uncharacterized protein n=1 Tax=Smallanthus sonchifolius TaxID=185202 RepID=A0ACB9G2D0_9ASTR|nr:hypothetical protein L1987_47143 [Smallanthus sonchifolius]
MVIAWKSIQSRDGVQNADGRMKRLGPSNMIGCIDGITIQVRSLDYSDKYRYHHYGSVKEPEIFNWVR